MLGNGRVGSGEGEAAPLALLAEFEELVALKGGAPDVSVRTFLRLNLVDPEGAGRVEDVVLLLRMKSDQGFGAEERVQLNSAPFGSFLEAQRMAARVLKETRSVKATLRLRFSDDHISADYIHAVADALKETKASDVDISQNNVGVCPGSGNIFAEALKVTNVRKLNLSSNQFGTSAGSALEWLSALKECRAQELILANNNLGVTEAAGLAAAELLESRTLKRLDLSGNGLGVHPAVAVAVADALGRTSIETVNLSSDTFVTPETCAAFGRALARTGAKTVTLDNLPTLNLLNKNEIDDRLSGRARFHGLRAGYLDERTKMKEDPILQALAAKIYEGMAFAGEGLPNRSGDFVDAFTEHVTRRGTFTGAELGRMRAVSREIARIR